MKRLILLQLLSLITVTFTIAQYDNVDFEPGGLGASWTWIMDQNADNPPLEFIANPVSGGINTTPNVAKFTARLAGQPWALTYTDDLDEFQFDATNTTVKIMVYKPTISNVGMKFEGSSAPIELLVANTVINQWEELTFDFSGQIGNTYDRLVIIPDFDFGRTQENILYFDNIQIPEGNIAPPPVPTVGAPIPIHNEVTNNVISVFSDSYTNVGGVNLNPNWGQGTVVTEENIAGNNTLKYANLNYQGTEYSNQDVSGHDFLHVDFWTADATALNFYVISPGNEIAYPLTIVPNQWNSIEIPLSAYTPPVNLSDVFQFKVDGNGTVYFDNFYFYEQVGMPAAPDPIHDEVVDCVISIFSDSYTNVPGTDFNPNWGQSTVVTQESIAGNNTLKYANLNYQGTQYTNQDVSGRNFLHVDFYTDDASFLDFYLISTGPQEIAYPLTVIPGQWNSVEIPLSAFTPPVNLADVFQFKVVGNGTVYFDNFYFYKGMPAAPEPVHDEVANCVISIFSDSYTNVAGTDLNPNWGQQTVTTLEDIAGNSTLKYANLDYQGTQYISQDVSGLDFLHVDFYTDDATFLDFYLISTGPQEIAYSLTVIPGQWNSVEIPLSAFTPPVNLADVFQFKVVGNGTVYFDNYYFYKEVAPTVSIELCVDLSCQASVTAPSVYGDFNGWSANANPVTDLDGDGIYCATVEMDPGVQEYKFFTQETGPEEFAAALACTTNGPTNINREITVVAGSPQSVTYAWETCDAVCIPIPTVDIELCVDMSCLGAQAPSVFGGFNGWDAGANPVTDLDGDGIYCATVSMQVGDQYFKFFDQIQGPENFTSVIPGCTGVNGVNIDRVITVVENQPQSITYAFNTCDPSCPKPTEGAPTPIHDEADNCVISIFSDSYTNVPGTDLNPNWGQQTVTTVIDVDGNNTLRYANLNYQGTQFTGQNVADHDFIHVDFWTSNATALDFYLISPGNEIGFSLQSSIVSEQWVSVDIPLSYFVPPVDLSNVFQFKVVGNGTVYFDNFYFWQEAIEWFADTDMDGYGDPNSSIFTCSPPANYVLDNTDCNDMEMSINPGAIEIPCNGIDDDCVGGDYIPAPATTMLPSFPSSISCGEAEGFSAPNATYDNGELGIYNISGTIVPQVVNQWDACGGEIIVTYPDVVDLCGRTITGGTFTINVQPASLPVTTAPALPTSVSCGDAETYMAPMATYDNGETGACNLSGNVTAAINRFYDECGGFLQIIYLGEDECGRDLSTVVVEVPVDPAPAPTLDVPTYPTSMTCGEANDFVGMDATFSNGLSGDCEISGWVDATVVKDVDACSGGTVTVTYNGEDDCGNALISAPIVISVEPAAPATIHLPQDANPIYCWEAVGFVPENAIFSNGESGFCENSGELVATTVVPYWNNCDGGFFMVQYSGFDNCGNYLESDYIAINVLPDTWAPQGECMMISEKVEEIKDIPSPGSLNTYMSQIASSFSDYCGNVMVTLIDDSGDPECTVEGTFERTYQLEVADECGNVAEVCSLTFYGTCNPLYCTMSEEFYSSDDQSFAGMTANEMIDVLIGSGADPIEIGNGDCGFTLDDAACIQAALQGDGQSISLPNDFQFSCGNTSDNNLVNQVITTTLNIRYNAMMNGAGFDFGGFHLDAACMNIPGYIRDQLPGDPTVNDLIEMANDFIGCQCNGTCGAYPAVMADLTGIFLGLNSRFNQCYAPGPCFLDDEENENDGPFVFSNEGKKSDLPKGETFDLDNSPAAFDLGKNGQNFDINLFPNPTNDILNIQLNQVDGKLVVIELFNIHGSKIGEKFIDASQDNLIKWDVNQFPSGMYWLSVKVDENDQVVKRIIISQ